MQTVSPRLETVTEATKGSLWKRPKNILDAALDLGAGAVPFVMSFLQRFFALTNSLRALGIRDRIVDLPSADILMFLHDANQTVVVDGRFYSPILDPLRLGLEDRGLSVASISHFGSVRGGTAAHANPAPANRSHLKARLLDTTLSVASRFFPTKIPIAFFRERMFLKIYRQTGARLALTIGLPLGLSRAAAKSGVTTVEVLHGFGYDELPFGYDTRVRADLPDFFLAGDCLSGQTFKSLEPLGVKTEVIEPLQLRPPTTHLSVASAIDKALSDQDQESRGFTAKPEGQILVLVAMSRMSPINGRKDSDPTDWKVLMECINQLGPSVGWLFRMHPVQFAGGQKIGGFSKIRNFIEEAANCEWEYPTTAAPTELFREADCLLTFGSEIVFDASFFGIPSALLVPPSRAVESDASWLRPGFRSLVESGHLEIIDASPDDVTAWIMRRKRVLPHHDSRCRPLTFKETITFLASKAVKP